MNEWINPIAGLPATLTTPPTTLGLDTEFMRVNTFTPKLALIQLAVNDGVFLIDPLAHPDLSPLTVVLSHPATLCVMHSASEDLEALAPFLPHGLGALFDTQLAAAFSGLGASVGYQKLVSLLLGIELTKTETRSDWLKRPLTSEQIEYASHDVLHLSALHVNLTSLLNQRGYAAWHSEDCSRIVQRACERSIDPEPQIHFRRAAPWPREKQALLKRILLWRETIARTLDLPRPWIVDDAHALDFAAAPPRDSDELFQRARGLRALQSPLRAELLGVLSAPLTPHELEFVPIPAELNTEEKRLLRTLKGIVVTKASELDLPEGLLCARRHLEMLLTTHTWPIALEGWRKTLLHDEFMKYFTH